MAAIRPMECPGSSAAIWLALVKQVAVGSRRSAAHSAARRRKAPSTIIAGTASSHNKAPDTRLPPATRRPMVKRAMGIDKTGFPQPFLGWTRVARNAIRPDVAVDSAAHSGDRSRNCQRNRDGSPPLRSADAIDWNDIPRTARLGEKTNKMSKSARELGGGPRQPIRRVAPFHHRPE
jgi:hypothetical protein